MTFAPPQQRRSFSLTDKSPLSILFPALEKKKKSSEFHRRSSFRNKKVGFPSSDLQSANSPLQLSRIKVSSAFSENAPLKIVKKPVSHQSNPDMRRNLGPREGPTRKLAATIIYFKIALLNTLGEAINMRLLARLSDFISILHD
jgi:hypothetical protein